MAIPKVTTPIVVIGGAEERGGKQEILRRFVQLSGGSKATIVVLSSASYAPEITAQVYVDVFKRMGTKSTISVTATSRDQLCDEVLSRSVGEATGLFITGGDQLRLASMVGGTPFVDVVEELAKEEKIVLAGTSAGAAVLSETMLIGWEPSAEALAGNVSLSPGLGFLPRVIVDQHFTERDRLNRLITAVVCQPGCLGLGLDENTAAVVLPDGNVEIIGNGTATVVDGSGITESTLADTPPGQPFAVSGLRIHLLRSSLGYNLYQRTAVDLSDQKRRL